MLAVNVHIPEGILAEGMPAESILGESILAGDMKTKNCDCVDNPLGCLGLTLNKTKRHPLAMKRCMWD